MINSTFKGTKVDNVAFSKTKIHPIRIAFFHAPGYFQTRRETGTGKKSSPTRRGNQLYLKPQGFLFIPSVRKSKYHTDYLFTSSTKGVHFLSQQLSIQQFLSDPYCKRNQMIPFWRKLNWLLYCCWDKARCPALLYWWQNHDVSNSNCWTLPEMALAGQQLCSVLFRAKLYKQWHTYPMGHPKGLCSSSLGDLLN